MDRAYLYEKGTYGNKALRSLSIGQRQIVPKMLEHTTTLGVRTYNARRTILPRGEETVETAYGAIRVKTAMRCGRMTAKPENEDVQRAAKAANVSYETVYEAAMNARK